MIGRTGSDGIAFNAVACLRGRPAFAACARCADACPAESVTLADQTIAIGESCVGCGRCAAACPTGALEASEFPPFDQPPVGDVIRLECHHASGTSGKDDTLRVPCLGGATPEHLMALRLAADRRPILVMDHGWCGDCPAGCRDGEPVARLVGACGVLFTELGLPSALWPRHVRSPRPVAERRTWSPSGMSRRTLFRRLGLDHAATPAATAKPATLGRRRRALALQRKIAARFGAKSRLACLPAITIADSCQGNGICTAVCPTGAIERLTDGDQTGLNIHRDRCLDCGRCAAACPEGAITITARGDAALPLTIQVVRGRTRICSACGDDFVAIDERTTCPSCAKSAALFAELRPGRASVSSPISAAVSATALSGNPSMGAHDE